MVEVTQREPDTRQARNGVSEAGFNSVVQNSPDSIVVMDSVGTIKFVNHASAIMLGYTRDKLLGKSFGCPVMFGDTTEIDVLHPARPPVVAEMRVVDVEWEGQPCLLATLRDISEHEKMTRELMQLNSDLKDFASVVSHEIRAPLRNLHMLSGWLLEDHSADLNTDALEDVQLMRKTTGRMQRMVEDLLHYSRVGLQKKISTNVDLEEVLVDALDNLQEEIFKSEAQFFHDPLPKIDCSVQQMITMFQHIISNAIAHCSLKPRITISVSHEDDMWKISFVDNGIGVEKKHWEKMFVPFNHLRAKDSTDGSGIGLATCKKIVELHQGKIWLESDIGVGSVVHLCLPKKMQG